jgi:hypothetical protein
LQFQLYHLYACLQLGLLNQQEHHSVPNSTAELQLRDTWRLIKGSTQDIFHPLSNTDQENPCKPTTTTTCFCTHNYFLHKVKKTSVSYLHRAQHCACAWY